MIFWEIWDDYLEGYLKIHKICEASSEFWKVLKYHEPIFIPNTPQKACYFCLYYKEYTTMETINLAEFLLVLCQSHFRHFSTCVAWVLVKLWMMPPNTMKVFPQSFEHLEIDRVSYQRLLLFGHRSFIRKITLQAAINIVNHLASQII